MTHRNYMRLLVASAATAVVMVCGALVATIAYAKHQSDDRKAEQIAGCERASDLRRTVNAIIVEQGLATPAILIPDCSAIIK